MIEKTIDDLGRIAIPKEIRKSLGLKALETVEIYERENAICIRKKRAQNEWISVKDRLPENDYEKHWKDRNYYLVRIAPSGLMRVAKYGYKNYNWWIDSHDYVLEAKSYTEVTHWMPLPDAPKGGAE